MFDLRRIALATLLVALLTLMAAIGGGERFVASAAAAAPNTYLHGGPTGTTTSRSARFHAMTSGGAKRIQCKLNARPWRVCVRSSSGYVTLRNLSRRRHTLLVRGVNASGQVDRSPAKRVWRVK